MLAAIDKKCSVAFFEICTDFFASVEQGVNKYREPSKFPAIEIDLTFLCNIGEVDFVKVREAAAAAAGGVLSTVVAKDVFLEADGSSAFTVRFGFVSPERTLTKQELQPAIDAIVEVMGGMGLTLKA